MADLRFLTLARDPNLVPGIYNGCDRWCHYCPATARCLAFKCQPASGDQADIYGNIHAAMFESMRYLKACHDTEGLKPPDDLVRILGLENDRPAFVPVDDALERMGKRYAQLATVFLATSGETLPPNPLPKRPFGPTPFEIFLYDHVLIASKIYRAIASSLEAARTGAESARWDADVSAKVALICIARSRDALQVMALDDPDARLEHMRKHLARLQREIEGRFPAARTLVRPGLDDPLGSGTSPL
jgi:hypothetical protein